MKTRRFLTTIIIFTTITCRLLAYTPPSPQELKTKADAGDASAQAMLGESYYRGEWGVETDYKMALKYLVPAAKQGHPVALYALGAMYDSGSGVDKDEEKGKEFSTKAFPGLAKGKETADPRWLQNLAYLYEAGLGTEKDLETSVQLSLKSAEQGYARAQRAVGKAYMNGAGVPADKQATVRWFLRAAEQGDVIGQYWMGLFYKFGEGYVDKDIDEALKWFKMSADQGHAEAVKEVKELTPEKTVDFALDETKAKAEKLKGETLVFKGFYLGMPIADAQGLINHYMGLKQVTATPIEDNSTMTAAKNSDKPQAAVASVMLQALGSQVQGMTPAQLRAQGLDDDTIAALGITDPDAPYRSYSRNGHLFVSKGPQSKPFAEANSKGEVTHIELTSEVIRKLFGSMPAKEFLQAFVNAYDVSELEGERQKITATIMGNTQEIGFQNIYRNRDAKGYEVIYYADSVIFDDDMKTFADTPPEGTMTIRRIETAKQRESKFD